MSMNILPELHNNQMAPMARVPVIGCLRVNLNVVQEVQQHEEEPLQQEEPPAATAATTSLQINSLRAGPGVGRRGDVPVP